MARLAYTPSCGLPAVRAGAPRLARAPPARLSRAPGRALRGRAPPGRGPGHLDPRRLRRRDARRGAAPRPASPGPSASVDPAHAHDAHGSRHGRELFGDRVTHAWLPWDYRFAARRFLARARPDFGVLLETELWPNLLAECHARRVPVLLVNARLSARSAAGYARVGAWPARRSPTSLASRRRRRRTPRASRPWARRTWR